MQSQWPRLIFKIFLGLMGELSMTSDAKEFEDQEKEIENAAAAERERRKELGMDFDKAHGHLALLACQPGSKPKVPDPDLVDEVSLS